MTYCNLWKFGKNLQPNLEATNTILLWVLLEGNANNNISVKIFYCTFPKEEEG